MAIFSEETVYARGYILSAVGAEYGKPRSPTPLVIQKKKGGLLESIYDYDAHGFDIGAMLESFDEHAAAESFLQSLRRGQATLNPYREIDLNQIQIREMLMDINVVDFTDDEHADMAVLGALDSMKYEDVWIIKSVWPVLEKISILDPEQRPFATKDGNPSAYADCCYILGSKKERTLFDQLAEKPDLSVEYLSKDTEQSRASIIYNIFRSALYRHPLKRVAEEVGKARLGIIENVDDREVFQLRLYDVNDTLVPSPQPEQPNPLIRAYKVLQQYDETVWRSIFDALKYRGIDPKPPGMPPRAISLEGSTPK